MFTKLLLQPAQGSTVPVSRSKVSTIALPIAATFFLIAVGFFLAHLLSFRFSMPPQSTDEGSFFSPAQDLAENGSFASPVHADFLPGASRYTYWMPPLFMLVLAGVFKVFGATVLNAKLLTFVLVSISAFLITRLSNDLYTKISLAGLYLVCPYIITASAFIRMEGLALLLVTITILAVKFQARAHWMGILAGLMTLTHPMLMACSVALAIHVLRRNFRSFLIFGFVALALLSPYVLYVLQDPAVYKAQMDLQLARKAGKRLSDLKPDYVLQSLPISLIALFVLYKLRKATELRLFLAIALILTLALVLKSSEFNYQVYVMPFVIAAAGLAMDEYEDNPIYRFVLPLFIYGVFTVLLVARMAKYKFRTDKPYKEIATYLDGHRGWEGKNIFVDGKVGITTFLMENHQKVVARNAVANIINENAIQQYNYVIEITDNLNKEGDHPIREAPWRNWTNKDAYTTTDGTLTLHIFDRAH